MARQACARAPAPSFEIEVAPGFHWDSKLGGAAWRTHETWSIVRELRSGRAARSP